jgi:hypothetical protein
MATPTPAPISSLPKVRKRVKPIPKLSPSAFTPPPTGASDRFPFSPSASVVSPTSIIDANVVASEVDLSQWISEAGPLLSEKIKGVVLSLNQDNVDDAVERSVIYYFTIMVVLKTLQNRARHI